MLVLKKVTLLTLSLLLVASVCMSQTVKVKKESARVKGENTDGYATDLTGAEEEVTTALLKYLKALGKVRQSDGILVVAEPTINGTAFKTPVYAVVKSKGNISTAWLGVKGTEWPAANFEDTNKELEKMTREFGLKYYRDKIQVQIDESTQAGEAVAKQKQRLTNENKNLNNKLEDNKQEKIRLEKALENNRLEHDMLVKKLEKNKMDQDSVATSGEQVKKVIEMHKERQRKVN